MAREVFRRACEPRGEDPTSTRVLSCPCHDLDHVHAQRWIDVDILAGGLHRDHTCWVRDDVDIHSVLLPIDSTGEDLVLIRSVGVADAHLEHESVKLSFRQRVGSFLLDGVLVAMTMNGAGNLCVTVPMVTCFSCMASSKAACVLVELG